VASGVFDPTVFDAGVFETGGGAAAELEASGTFVLSGTADLRDRPAINMSASGSFPMTASASLLLAVQFMASGSFLLAAAAALTTEILMEASGDMILTAEGRLRVARNIGRLEDCGDPLSTACQEGWMPGA
jgi:hypothetical protein